MRPLADFDPIGPVVGVAIGIVEEAAVLDQKRAGVLARRVAALPAERTTSDRAFEPGKGGRDCLSLLLFGKKKMPDETLAMATDVKTKILDRFRYLRIARKRLGAGVDRERDAAFPHQVNDPPKADARAIFEQRFSDEIAHSRRHFLPNAVGQRRFRGIVAVGDRRFCTLFDIENDNKRQARPVRPARIGWRPAVTDEISLVIGFHLSSDAAGKAVPIFSARSSRS